METGTIILVIIGLIIYFVPTAVGWKTKYASGIFLLNLFLGWTILGWIGALIWAVSAPKEIKKQYYKIPNSNSRNWFKEIRNIFHISKDQYVDKRILALSINLKQGEAIVKNNTTSEFEIMTADQWETILADNRQDEYEIIEEK
jgi:hypothetical protein